MIERTEWEEFFDDHAPICMGKCFIEIIARL